MTPPSVNWRKPDRYPDGVLKALLYLRVSSPPQAKRSGLWRQEDACRQAAEDMNAEVVDVYRDVISGDYLLSLRPEGARLLNDLAGGRGNVVIVESMDRFSRSAEGASLDGATVNLLGAAIQFADYQVAGFEERFQRLEQIIAANEGGVRLLQ